MKTGLDKVIVEGAEVKKNVAEVKKDVAEVKKDTAEVKKDVADVKVQINEMNLILSAVYKDKIAIMKAKEAQPNNNQAI